MNKHLLLALCFLTASIPINAQDSGSTVAAARFSENAAAAKRNVIRIFPNPSYGKLSVIATTTDQLHFYVFDLEGTLVYQTLLSNKEKKNIENLPKGTYIYDVFEKDLSIEEGKIIIK